MKTTIIVLGMVLISASTAAQRQDYDHKLGVRFFAGRGGYVGISPDYHPAYTIGLQYIKKLRRPNWGLSAGLNLASLRIATSRDVITYRHLQLPLAMRLEHRGLYLEGGVYADYLVMVNSGQSAFTPLDPARKPSLGFNFGGGYEASFSDKILAFLEFRYLGSLISGQAYRGFRSYGLAIGLNYKF